MIDPFTGTGIQIALRTGEIAAEAILEARNNSPGLVSNVEQVLSYYQMRYDLEFNNRMMAAGMLRGVAFSPRAANFLAGVFARLPWLARRVLRATRSGNNIQRAINQN
jgi:flavin-dependent dehydrogenase